MFSYSKTIGIAFCGFGLGILLAKFLPATLLIIIESAVILIVGILFSKS